MSVRRRSPRPLTTALTELRGRVAPQTVIAEVQQCWPELVGEVIAQEARPLRERAGVVTISCSSAVWAAELEADAMVILERLSSALGPGRVTRLRWVIEGRE